MVYILMGVSGAGKTLIGNKLSRRLKIPFYDGDDFHPQENIDKMRTGQPLNDDDRRPWLETLAGQIQQWEQEGGAILGCSALKKSYRIILRSQCDNSCFIYLKGTLPLIAGRLSKRANHFMPESLLKSQFDALEEPEEAITIEVDQSPEEVVQDILDRIGEKSKGH